jgi:hypothetical protein
VITQANFIYTMPANGNGVAALALSNLHQGAQKNKPQSLRGSSFIANLLHTTASFWACLKIAVLRGESALSAAPENLLSKRPGIRKNPGLFIFSFSAVIALLTHRAMHLRMRRTVLVIFNNLYSRAAPVLAARAL